MKNPNSTRQGGNASEVIASLNDAVCANPIAATLIGLGAIWLFAGGSRIAAVGGAVGGATGSAGAAVGSGITSVSRAVGGGISTASHAVGGAARDLKDTIVESTQSSAGAIRHGAEAGYDAIKQGGSAASGAATADAAGLTRMAARGTEIFGSAQKNLTQALERQPLVLGGIGLAIGAVIASAFALTQAESNLIGDTAAKLRGGAEDFAANAADTVRQVAGDVLDTVKDEAQRQGLTATDLKDSLLDVGGKIKAVAGETRDSVKQRL